MKRNTICMTVFVMQHCNRLSAQRRSPGATLWWRPRRWPRSKHQLVGFPICICIRIRICLCTCRFSKFSRFVTIQSSKPYFSLGPVFSEWGRENLVREVFQDTELEIFPWQGTLKVSHVYFGPLQRGWFSIFVWDWGAAIGGDEDTSCCDTIVALQWLWRSVHNFNSEQRNCLVILSLSGSDLNLKWKLDLSLIRIVWFRVNVRSVELSSTRTREFQTPTQDISIPWTQHQGRL